MAIGHTKPILEARNIISRNARGRESTYAGRQKLPTNVRDVVNKQPTYDCTSEKSARVEYQQKR